MKNIILSIIIPAYNSENSIQKCLKSIIPQLNKSCELIVINDGSKDKTENIVKGIFQQYESLTNLIYIYQENSGVSKTRNKGIDISSGKYLWFIDSDDFVESIYVNDVYRYLNEQFDIMLFDYTVVGSAKNINEPKLEDIEMNKNSFLKLVSSNFFTTFISVPWNKIYLRSIIVENKIYFNCDLFSNEDYLFNLHYYNYVNSAVINSKKIYNYVVEQKESLSKRQRTLEYSWNVTKKLYLSLMKLYGENNKLVYDFFMERIYNDLSISKYSISNLYNIYNDDIFKNIDNFELYKKKTKKARFIYKNLKSHNILIIYTYFFVKKKWRKLYEKKRN